MSKMEQISAERRREENIKKNMEFQMQIGLTRIAENDVVSLPEKKFRQEYVKRKNIEATSRRSKRIEKRVEDERNSNEKMQKRMEFSCKYCYKVYRKARIFTCAGALKIHQRNPKCALYRVDGTSIDTGNTSYVQVFQQLLDRY